MIHFPKLIYPCRLRIQIKRIIPHLCVNSILKLVDCIRNQSGNPSKIRMKSFVQNTPVSTSAVLYRSFSKKHNSDYSSPAGKGVNKRAMSRKGNISSYGYCPKDIETLRDENIKLKEEILGLRAEILDQKSLIISLQRAVSTTQFRDSISTQKSINLNLQQEKHRLAERLRVVEQELKGIKKQAKSGNTLQLEEEKNWYKEEVLRLRGILLRKIKGNASQSETEIKMKEDEKAEDGVREYIMTGGDQILSNSDSTSKQLNKEQDPCINKVSDRNSTSLSRHSLKRALKDDCVITKTKIKQSTRQALQTINNSNQPQKIILEGRRQSKVAFMEETILPYNSFYSKSKKHRMSFGSFRGKSILEKRDFESPKRSFVA